MTGFMNTKANVTLELVSVTIFSLVIKTIYFR